MQSLFVQRASLSQNISKLKTSRIYPYLHVPTRPNSVQILGSSILAAIHNHKLWSHATLPGPTTTTSPIPTLRPPRPTTAHPHPWYGAMLSYRTTGFNGYAVKYSPFFDSRIACAASANFGLVGNGRLYILALTPQGIVAEKWFDTQDSLFDVQFSEANANQLAAASGDGSIKLFDTTLDDFPIRQWREHTREVFSLSWNLVDKNLFASSSWDGNVKIWSPTSPQSLRTINIGSCTYSVAFQPSSPTVLSAVSSDGFMRVFDLRAPEGSVEIAKTRVSPGEVLTQDWNKYQPTVIATGGVDRAIRTWDLKMPNQCQTELVGHDYAVRKIAWSPHWQDVLLSASYDMTVRVWTDGSTGGAGTGLGGAGPGGGRLMGVMDRHTEFCAGVDWCLFGGEGWAASTGWDETVWVWDVGGIIGSR